MHFPSAHAPACRVLSVGRAVDNVHCVSRRAPINSPSLATVSAPIPRIQLGDVEENLVPVFVLPRTITIWHPSFRGCIRRRRADNAWIMIFWSPRRIRQGRKDWTTKVEGGEEEEGECLCMSMKSTKSSKRLALHYVGDRRRRWPPCSKCCVTCSVNSIRPPLTAVQVHYTVILRNNLIYLLEQFSLVIVWKYGKYCTLRTWQATRRSRRRMSRNGKQTLPAVLGQSVRIDSGGFYMLRADRRKRCWNGCSCETFSPPAFPAVACSCCMILPPLSLAAVTIKG